MGEELVQLASPRVGPKEGGYPDLRRGFGPRSEASLEPGEGVRSRPESGRLRAARPVAIGSAPTIRSIGSSGIDWRSMRRWRTGSRSSRAVLLCVREGLV
jgi:hypothetical protein